MEHATRALDISRELGWAPGEASGRGLRGFTLWSMARLDSAYDDFTAGLRIFREIGHRYFEGFGVVGLGMACRDLGRLHEAAEHLERAVHLEAEVSWWDANSALQILGGVYWELGRLTDGLDLLGPEVASDKRAGYRDGRAMMFDAIAKINVELGRHGEGLEQAERAFALVEDTKRHWVQSGILNTVAGARRGLRYSWTGLFRPASRLSPWPASRDSDEPRRDSSDRPPPSPTRKRAGTTRPAPTPNRAPGVARAHSFPRGGGPGP
ncbi:hypothetical protein ACRAWF_40630 [Streptomyces sp. L7]